MNSKRMWSKNRIIEQALEEAEPAAKWLQAHPPGARMPDELEPGHKPDEEVAWDRAEDDYCERGTQGCSVHHTGDSECQTW